MPWNVVHQLSSKQSEYLHLRIINRPRCGCMLIFRELCGFCDILCKLPKSAGYLPVVYFHSMPIQDKTCECWIRGQDVLLGSYRICLLHWYWNNNMILFVQYSVSDCDLSSKFPRGSFNRNQFFFIFLAVFVCLEWLVVSFVVGNKCLHLCINYACFMITCHKTKYIHNSIQCNNKHTIAFLNRLNKTS